MAELEAFEIWLWTGEGKNPLGRPSDKCDRSAKVVRKEVFRKAETEEVVRTYNVRCKNRCDSNC